MLPESLTRDAEGRSLVTHSRLVEWLRAAGLTEGQVVCAHVGLKALGHVCGAAQCVVEALLDTVGERGTLMMPAFTGENSDPAEWRYPPVPADWINPIRAETPPYNPFLSPTRGVGVVGEYFRLYPGTHRSAHPHSSFAANGAHSRELVDGHRLDYRFGPASPVGRLAELDGFVLLLGAAINKASFVYLAQYLCGIGSPVRKTSVIMRHGAKTTVSYDDIQVQNSLIAPAVEFLLQNGIARTAKVGDAKAVLFNARMALRELIHWRWKVIGMEHENNNIRLSTPDTWNNWLR